MYQNEVALWMSSISQFDAAVAALRNCHPAALVVVAAQQSTLAADGQQLAGSSWRQLALIDEELQGMLQELLSLGYTS